MNHRTAWTDGVSQWLIQRAARRAPGDLSERLQEEWLADLAARSPGGSRLRFAIGCCWATRVIAYEHEPSVRVAGTVAGAKLALSDAPNTWGYLSRRSSILFFVVTLHVVLFYALMAKLSYTHASLPPPPFINQPVEEPPPKALPRPPGEPGIERSIIEPERPILHIPPDSDPPDTRPEVDDPTPIPQTETRISEPPPAHIVQRTSGGPGAGFPNAEDFYPDAAKRLGEQGIATMQVCVDARGRLTSEPTTLQSTGSSRLDQGALKLARAASGHYRASTEDGQPVNSCYSFRIRFQLKN